MAEMTVEEKLDLLREMIKGVTQRLDSVEKRPVHAPIPSSNPTPQAFSMPSNDPFTSLRGLISAFKELRAYDNEVISSYKNTLSEVMPAALEGEYEPADPLDAVFAQLMGKLIVPQTQQTTSLAEMHTRENVGGTARQASSTQAPSEPSYIHTGAENMKLDENDPKIIAKGLPAAVKAGIKSGVITLDMAKTHIKNSQYAELFNDEDIEKIYHEAKNP